MAGVDKLEEQIAAADHGGTTSDRIDDEQRGTTEEASRRLAAIPGLALSPPQPSQPPRPIQISSAPAVSSPRGSD